MTCWRCVDFLPGTCSPSSPSQLTTLDRCSLPCFFIGSFLFYFSLSPGLLDRSPSQAWLLWSRPDISTCFLPNRPCLIAESLVYSALLFVTLLALIGLHSKTSSSLSGGNRYDALVEKKNAADGLGIAIWIIYVLHYVGSYRTVYSSLYLASGLIVDE